MSEFYAGIGSRATPNDVLNRMQSWAKYLSNCGFTLRSGGAPGADQAFAKGAGSNKRIYLPWARFEGLDGIVCGGDQDLAVIAAQHHPAWSKLSPSVKKLMTRNVAQVLGYGAEKKRSAFVLCWTPGAKYGGGTGQAIRVALANNVPVFDLADPTASERLDAFLVGAV